MSMKNEEGKERESNKKSRCTSFHATGNTRNK